MAACRVSPLIVVEANVFTDKVGQMPLAEDQKVVEAIAISVNQRPKSFGPSLWLKQRERIQLT
jgi:hypothetical protein